MPELMSSCEILRRLTEKKRIYDFPRASERNFWENIPQKKKELLLEAAEDALQTEIPLLKAADYMKFFREGNRIAYETHFFKRRHHLVALVAGECIEYKGRFIDGIIESLWQTLSEPVWCLPAHQGLTKFPLPGPEDWVVDLFAAETGKILTDVLQLLGPELEKIAPPIVERIRFEVSRRVLEVCEKTRYWWHEGSNNWSVWCCFSAMSSAIEIWQEDLPRLADFIAMYMEPVQKFFNRYPADGGCNEGPTYWVVAVGMMMNAIDILQRRIGGMEPWLQDEKVKNMVEFIPKLNIEGKWFMGFSDAESCFFRFPRGLFVKYGRMVNSDMMINLAVNMPEPDAPASLGNRNTGILETMADLTEDLSCTAPFVPHDMDFWPDLQIWIARKKDPESSMICTLKGGHNRQSHNHLDLGHFSLFSRNKPVIIDVGRGVYDRKCFSEHRYTIWNLNSDGHNAARFDGMQQGFGSEYTSSIDCHGDRTICDLTGAYCSENGISSYVRQLFFDRNRSVLEISEKACFEGRKTIDIALYTPVAPGEIKENSLQLGDITLACEGIKIKSVVKADWADEKLQKTWGDLWQINLQCSAESCAEWQIVFSQVN